jgi:hypothetical protein
VNITIDNLDGRGAVDYSGALCAGTSLNDHPLKIERVLNAPSRASGMLDLSGSTLAAPVRRARVVVTSDNSTVLFTGYLATEPERVYTGVASTGPVYRYAFSAVSDEWLLDKQAFVTGGASLGQAAGLALTTLTDRVGSGLFTTTGVAAGRSVGVFAPAETESWSANAGRIADSAYAAYRVLDGAISMQSAGAVTHALSDGDGTLQIAVLKTAAVASWPTTSRSAARSSPPPTSRRASPGTARRPSFNYPKRRFDRRAAPRRSLTIVSIRASSIRASGGSPIPARGSASVPPGSP